MAPSPGDDAWFVEQPLIAASAPRLNAAPNTTSTITSKSISKDGGRAALAFFQEVTSFLKENASDESLAGFLKPLEAALGQLQQATMWFMQNALARPDHAGAGATDYMHMFGLVVLGYMWVRIAKAAQEKLKAGADGDASRMETKLTTARFFMQRLLPETGAQLARITSGADAVMALSADAF